MNTTAIKVIITGATGMVGEGVLHECLQNPEISEVLIVNRKSLGLIHPKLKEIIHADFFDLSAIESQLEGYQACFFCLGITSVGVDDATYFKMTYSLTLHFARILSTKTPDMTFCYVSGVGTDSTESGSSNWAKVKGKTENELMKLPFQQVYAFRPGFIKPTKGLSKTHNFYKYISWLFPLGRALYPNGFCTLEELALSMIYVTGQGKGRQIINGTEIIALARQQAEKSLS